MNFRLAASLLLGVFLLAGCFSGVRNEKIQNGKRVKIHYTFKVDGHTVDSSSGREPFEFRVGSLAVIPGLEEALMGLSKGDRIQGVIPPEQAFGKVNPEILFERPKEKLPSAQLKEGALLSAPGPEGEPYHATVREIRKTTAVLDFNHPYAGKSLEFDLEVIDVV